MSLPLAFKTTLDTIPANLPYLFADTEKTRHWQARLGEKTCSRIGLVWSGSATHQNDHLRSLSLTVLEDFLQLPLEFHCLQKELRGSDTAVLEGFPQLQLHQQALSDFAETAALIANLDLVISVDTSVAHLAAALGKPMWILLPKPCDYRWLLDRTDSPWYPTATLFRQSTYGDWQAVVASVHQKLLNTYCSIA
jgi:hypothetical protein